MAAEGAAFALEAGAQEFDVGDEADDLPLDRDVVAEVLPRLQRLVPDTSAQYGGDAGVGGALLVFGGLTASLFSARTQAIAVAPPSSPSLRQPSNSPRSRWDAGVATSSSVARPTWSSEQ